MKTAKPLREMAPGVAWNDASRRSLAICIGGFFLPNLLAEFGAVPQLHQRFHFLPGVCGAAGAYLAALALFIGYYHRRLIQGVPFAICAFALPYCVTWSWFRWTHPSGSAGLLQLCAPTALVALVTYASLIWWHGNQSGLTMGGMGTQVAEDEYGIPTSHWQQIIVRVSAAIGFIVIVFVLLTALASRK